MLYGHVVYDNEFATSRAHQPWARPGAPAKPTTVAIFEFFAYPAPQSRPIVASHRQTRRRGPRARCRTGGSGGCGSCLRGRPTGPQVRLPNPPCPHHMPLNSEPGLILVLAILVVDHVLYIGITILSPSALAVRIVQGAPSRMILESSRAGTGVGRDPDALPEVPFLHHAAVGVRLGQGRLGVSYGQRCVVEGVRVIIACTAGADTMVMRSCHGPD
ncbi:hypothetical protein LXA43DRAFT_1008969 [Ganoderma leucocontextum]|nr:hypothetical protein LXA43DRAFT_1008969 [Ganoderma leucocontextum]